MEIKMELKTYKELMKALKGIEKIEPKHLQKENWKHLKDHLKDLDEGRYVDYIRERWTCRDAVWLYLNGIKKGVKLGKKM